MIIKAFDLMRRNQNLVAPKWALTILNCFRKVADNRGFYTVQDCKQGKVCISGKNIPEVCFITDFATRRAYLEAEIMLYPIKKEQPVALTVYAINQALHHGVCFMDSGHVYYQTHVSCSENATEKELKVLASEIFSFFEEDYVLIEDIYNKIKKITGAL